MTTTMTMRMTTVMRATATDRRRAPNAIPYTRTSLLLATYHPHQHGRSSHGRFR